MVEDMRASISALMDGQLAEHERAAPLAALGENGAAYDAWRSYHLISDALHGHGLLGSDCRARIVARLANEPVLIGVLPSDIVAPERARWFVPSAVAASVAAVALVGWMAFAPQPGPGPAIASKVSQPALAIAPVPAEPKKLPLSKAARDYVAAHQAYSPRNVLQGMAPYIHSVSVEAAPSKP